MLKSIKEVSNKNNNFLLEGIYNNKGTQLGMMISLFNEEGRRYLSQPQTMEEANEHLEFYQRVYK
jgi:hypothetical protein